MLGDQGEIVGCGGVYRHDDRTAEIKRMLLDRTLRGLGTGKCLLAELKAVAHGMGCSGVVLDTNATLEEAIAMYVGYEPTDRYNENPYAELWFSKRIDDPQK